MTQPQQAQIPVIRSIFDSPTTSSVESLKRVLSACWKRNRLTAALAELERHYLDFLDQDWPFWARTDQLPPQLPSAAGSWATWLLLGGRGAGKTRAGAEWVRAVAAGAGTQGRQSPVRIALVAETLADARDIMVEGISGLLAVHGAAWRPSFHPSKRRLEWPNGAVAYLFSAEDPDSLRGHQFSHAWCDETAKWRYPDQAWDMLQFGLRLGDRPQQVVTTTPRPIKLLKRMIADPSTVMTKAATRANAGNLAPGFLSAIAARYEGTRLGRQELDAEILEDNPHALWQRHMIERARVMAPPPLARTVVAVDPPASSGDRANACGIVTAAAAADGDAYVLADSTVERASPTEWARAAVAQYHRHEADTLVVEVNQGGEMARAVIEQVDRSVPVRAVRATRGKWVRAEPVAALYEQGRVHHVGHHPGLEDQMCEFVSGLRGSHQSPDRVDALVWALTDLMLGAAAAEPRIRRM